MEHLDFEITEMEHLNFLEFWEETRTAEQTRGWKLGIMYTFTKKHKYLADFGKNKFVFVVGVEREHLNTNS